MRDGDRVTPAVISTDHLAEARGAGWLPADEVRALVDEAYSDGYYTGLAHGGLA